jgi:eukaryotic-like serine/threonine-protein kinase
MVWPKRKDLKGGRYTIEDVLRQGRLSTTYLATTKSGDRIVIKAANDEAIERSDFDRLQERFIKEAFKLQKCEHPNIVKVFEPFQEEGLWCIPMEYIAGTTLDKRDRRRLPEAEAIRYVTEIGEALGILHGQGLIHRDVNPSNVMIRVRNGVSEAVLIDFGLVRDFATNLSTTSYTETTAFASSGKAPELYIRGGDRGSYTDLYSLGAMLYELVTGSPAPSAVDRTEHPQPLSFPGSVVSSSVVKLIESAMALKPLDRPVSVSIWLEKLTSGKQEDQSDRVRLPKKPINWVTVAAVVTAVAGLVAAVAAMVTAFQPKDSPPAKTEPAKTEKTK